MECPGLACPGSQTTSRPPGLHSGCQCRTGPATVMLRTKQTASIMIHFPFMKGKVFEADPQMKEGEGQT